jgi:hypothetical protein
MLRASDATDEHILWVRLKFRRRFLVRSAREVLFFHEHRATFPASHPASPIYSRLRPNTRI